MARMRTIKPEAFSSETLSLVSVYARWTFAGVWTYVDDDGRGKADPRLINAAVWPLDDDVTAKDVAYYLDELEREHLICRYEVDGKQYLHVVNFKEHQKPNRPVASKLPECPRRTHGGLTEDAVSPHGGVQPATLRPVRDDVAPDSRSETVGSAIGAENCAVSPAQMPLTEDSVSTHGAFNTNSFTNTPTPPPTYTPKGDGVGDGVGEGTSEVEPSDAPPVREDVERLCAHLADRVEANGCKRPAITRKWRDAARLLLDKDGRTEEQIHRAIDWCQDDEFWRGNVMAMPKLREQYDRLRLQAARGSPNSSGSHQTYRNPTDPSVYHEELRND